MTTNDQNKYAIIYVRTATIEKNTGKRIASQEKACREYANKNGITVLDVSYDLGVPGYTKLQDREGGQEMLLILETYKGGETYDGGIDVIVDDCSRLGRDVAVHRAAKKAITDRGGKLICVAQSFSEDLEPEKEFLENIAAAQSQYERQENTRCVISRMRTRLEQGYWCFGSILGYKYVPDPEGLGKILEPDGYNAIIIKATLEKFALGELLSIGDIQQCLNKAYIKQPAGISKKISSIICSARCAQTVLKNAAFYAGIIEYRPWGITPREGKHIPLISAATHQKIVDRLASPIPAV